MRLITILFLSAASLMTGCAVPQVTAVHGAPSTRPVEETSLAVAERKTAEAADEVVEALRKQVEAGGIMTPTFLSLTNDWCRRAVLIRSKEKSDELRRQAAVVRYAKIAQGCVNVADDEKLDSGSLNNLIVSHAMAEVGLLYRGGSEDSANLASIRLRPEIDPATGRAIAAIRVASVIHGRVEDGQPISLTTLELMLQWDRRAHLATPPETRHDGLIPSGTGPEAPGRTYARVADEMVSLSSSRFENDGDAGVLAIEISKYFKADAVHPVDVWQPAHDHLERDAARQMSESALKITDALAGRARFGEPLTVDFVNRCVAWSRAACLATISANEDPSERDAALTRHRHALQTLESELKTSGVEKPNFEVEVQSAMVKYLLCEADLWMIQLSAQLELVVVE